MYPCDPVDLRFLAEAPFRIVSSIDLPASQEKVFELLADIEVWPRWFDVITTAQWLHPGPQGTGSRRAVVMRGNVLATEEFILWQPHCRMVFRFAECSNPAVRASIEEYSLVATSDGCRLTWTLAQDPAKASWLTTALARWLITRSCRRALTRLARLLDGTFQIR